MNVIKSAEEMENVIKLLSKTNVRDFPIEDQLEMFQAQLEFANRIKPVLVRNIDKLPENETFIVKM